jgi:hypothetical protein
LLDLKEGFLIEVRTGRFVLLVFYIADADC